MVSAALALVVLWALPAWPQAREVSARGSPVGLDAELVEGVVAFLRSDPENSVAQETADALASGDIPVRIAAIHGRELGAVFDQETGAILINLAHVASRYTSDTEDPVDGSNQALILEGIRQSWERSPGTMEAFIRDTSPLMVHEVCHARYAKALGPHPSSMEEELACHAFESLFTRMRLKAEPDFLGIRQFDAAVRAALKEPAPGKEWWKDPFPFTALEQILTAVRSVQARFPGRFAAPPLLWLHVRSMSEGFGHFRLVFASSYPTPKFSLETAREEVLAELNATPRHERSGRLHRLAVSFWKDPARVKAAAGLLESERARAQALLEAGR